MLRDIVWKVAIHAAAWALMLLGSFSLLAWGHRLGAALLSALLIGFGILLGALARLPTRSTPGERTDGHAARLPAGSRRLSS